MDIEPTQRAMNSDSLKDRMEYPPLTRDTSGLVRGIASMSSIPALLLSHGKGAVLCSWFSVLFPMKPKPAPDFDHRLAISLSVIGR